MRARIALTRRTALTGVLLAAASAAAVAPLSRATAPKRPPISKPPGASTGAAATVGDTTASLNGSVNPRGQETTCYFQYGPTAAYGAQTPTAAAGAGTASVRVSQPVSGLRLGTLYHYRLVAMSAAGTTDGEDRTFTTKQVPLKFVVTPPSAPAPFRGSFTLSGTLTGTGAAGRQVILQANPFPYLGAFADVGTPLSTNAAGGFVFHVPGIALATKLRVRTLDPAPVYSPAVTERVAVLVTLRARPTGPRGLMRLEGTVTPAEAGAPVSLQWLRPARGPVTLATTRLRRGRGGVSRFGGVVTVRHSGLYRAFVRVSGGRLANGASNAVRLQGVAVHTPHG